MEDVMMAMEEFVMVTVPTERILWLRAGHGGAHGGCRTIVVRLWWPQRDCSGVLVVRVGL